MKLKKLKNPNSRRQLHVAAFFWKNNRPGGLGLRLNVPQFSAEQLTKMFCGETARKYFQDSDALLGPDLIATYFAQLAEISLEASSEEDLPISRILLGAWNIMYLAARGFIPNDEFNGPYLGYVDS